MLTRSYFNDAVFTEIPVGTSYSVNFKKEGTLALGGSDFIIRAPGLFQIQEVKGRVNTAADAIIIVNVLINAVGIWSAVGDFLRIPAGQLEGSSGPVVVAADTKHITDGDVLTIDIQQIGSGGNEGADLCVQLIGNVDIQEPAV